MSLGGPRFVVAEESSCRVSAAGGNPPALWEPSSRPRRGNRGTPSAPRLAGCSGAVCCGVSLSIWTVLVPMMNTPWN